MNIKKILAGGLVALTAGATIAFGAFAQSSSLADYVQTDTNAITSPMIVVGASAAHAPAEYPMDVVGAADIAAAVAGYATTEVNVGGGSSTEPSVSGGTLITSGLNKTYIGQSFSDVKSTLTKTELPTLLAPTTFTDMNSTSITLQYQIGLGDQTVNYGKPGEFTEPDLYVTFGSGYTYNLTVLFIGGLDTSAVSSDYTISLFGKDYTFGSTHTNESLVLYSSTGAVTTTLNGAGDTKTVTINGETYEFSLTGWNTDGTQAFLTVNGAATTPSAWSEHGTYTIPGTNIQVYVNDVSVVYTGAQEATGQVQLFIGTDKLTLNNGVAVEKNDESLVNTVAYFDGTSNGKINSLTIQVAPDIDTYMKNGEEFVDPVFGNIKFKLSDMTPSLTGREQVSVTQDGSNKVKLTFTNKDGTEYAVDVLYYDTGSSTWEHTIDGTHEFWTTEANTTTGANNITVGDYFVVTSNQNTYILRYASYYPSTTTSSRYVTLRDVATNTDYKVYYNTDEYLRIGSESFKVQMLGYGSDYAIGVDLNGDGTISNSQSVNISTQSNGLIDLSGNNWIVFYENPLYTISGSNEPSTSSINISASYSSNDINFGVSGVSTNQVGTQNKYRGMTNYGTLVETDTDADTVTISYPGDRPAYANVAVGTDPVVSQTSSGQATVEQAIHIQQPVAKLTSEINTDSLNSDLILLGGPVANEIVRKLLATEWGVDENQVFDTWVSHNYQTGMIKEITNAFGSGHKALIVAGTNGQNTRNLAAMVMQGTLSYEN